MKNKSELTPVDITDDQKVQLITQYVRDNLLEVSQQIFDDYIIDNTNQLDSSLQRWTTSEAALGAAVVNEMVNVLLKEKIEQETAKQKEK